MAALSVGDSIKSSAEAAMPMNRNTMPLSQMTLGFLRSLIVVRARLFLARPSYIANIRVRREDLLQGVRQSADGLRGVNFPDPFSDYRLARFDETEEFVVGALLMPTSNCQGKGVVLDAEQAAPVFGDDSVGGDS